MGISVRTSTRVSAARKAARAGLAGLLLTAGAVGCSKGDLDESPKMTPAAAVAKAAKYTQDITSMRYRMTGKVPKEGRIKADAELQLKPTAAMSMKMTALDQADTGTVEIRLVDKAMYINGGAASAKEMGGKSWMKFDLAAAGLDKGLDQLGGASQAEQNPAAESTFLTGSKNVRKVGTETVDGVETTHYKGTVGLDDLRKSLAAKSEAVRKAGEKSLSQYEKAGVDKMTMDMWIDGQDHAKQFRMRGNADKGPLDMTVTFLGFNEPVKVTAPPADATIDLAGLMKETGAN